MEPEINALEDSDGARAQLLSLYEEAGLSPHDGVQMDEKFDEVICHFSSDPEQGINDALDEWESMDEVVDLGGEEQYCCCSKKIRQPYYVQNRENGNILVIGKECVKKFDGDQDESDNEDDGFIASSDEEDIIEANSGMRLSVDSDEDDKGITYTIVDSKDKEDQ
jgi:hypothetical protein